MLSFVKINENSGIWANPDKALAYLAKGYKIYTDVDETVEVTEADLLAESQTDRGGSKGKGKSVVATGAKG